MIRRGQSRFVVVAKYEIVAHDRATALLTIREWLANGEEPPESLYIEAEYPPESTLDTDN